MTDKMIAKGQLRVAAVLVELVADQMAPGTGVDPEDFWSALADIVRDLAPKNASLLARRDDLQDQIDTWLRARRGQTVDIDEQKDFLTSIGYLVPESGSFEISTRDVDAEIALLAGPQLVVPVDNARYALNAANARWGSLYDALYGTDVVPELQGANKTGDYNPVRGAAVINKAAALLDEIAPLANGQHLEVTRYSLEKTGQMRRLIAELNDGSQTTLKDESGFVGFNVAGERLQSVLLRNNGLHIDILIDPEHPVGKTHPAGVKDIILEAALTTIQDCEDSVSAVDAGEKATVYRNWLGLMRGDLKITFKKAGAPLERRLSEDREYLAPDGSTLRLAGRSVLLVRNVGLHMMTDAVTSADGEPIPEGFLDAMMTSLAARHDLLQTGSLRNSRTGSIYIVKPKLHGADEVAATVELFARVEQALGLAPLTIKIGIMDEERRTTVNLSACIHAARERVIFINTGFLDRTGDEIHTLMDCGPVMPKEDIKSTAWMLAYEDQNVDIGLETGFMGRAQIGKGMWAMPDNMADMIEAKIAHPLAGASTAWVPSPTAAILHALHYHRVFVPQCQQELKKRERASLDDILTMPLLGQRQLTAGEIEKELQNNAQGILGYVVRWVQQGIGCSKVSDINDLALMEDRATLRISSQHIANWLHHEVVTREQIISVFKKMSAIVDRQNAGDAAYLDMAPDFDTSLAFQAALDLVFSGRDQPNGYTESVLHARRREFKLQNAS